MSFDTKVVLEVERSSNGAKGKIEFIPRDVFFAIVDKGDFCVFGMEGLEDSFIVRRTYEDLRAQLFDVSGQNGRV